MAVTTAAFMIPRSHTMVKSKRRSTSSLLSSPTVAGEGGTQHTQPELPVLSTVRVSLREGGRGNAESVMEGMLRAHSLVLSIDLGMKMRILTFLTSFSRTVGRSVDMQSVLAEFHRISYIT